VETVAQPWEIWLVLIIIAFNTTIYYEFERRKIGMLGILGWILVGAVLTGALLMFWNEIRDWLNNTAANAVESVLGYNARKGMQKAICVVDRVVNTVRNRAVIYTKKERLSTYMDKVTIEAKAPVYEIDEEVLKEIREKGKLEQELQFRG